MTDRVKIERRKQAVLRALSQRPDGMTVTELRSKVTGITRRDPAIAELRREKRILSIRERRNLRSTSVFRLTEATDIG